MVTPGNVSCEPMEIGWTLEDAMRRVLDENCFKELEDKQLDYTTAEKHKKSLSFVQRDSMESLELAGETFRNADEKLTALRIKMWVEFRAPLIAGHLIAMGRPQKADQPIQSIEKDQWSGLTQFDEERSIVSDGLRNGLSFFGVRFWPLIQAPDAAGRLAGNSLYEAVHLSIINDVEVRKLAGNASARPGNYLSARKSAAQPGEATEFSPGGSLLAKILGEVPASDDGTHGQPLPDASLELSKLSLLLDLLRQGKLIAHAIGSDGSLLDAINPADWRNKNGTCESLIRTAFVKLDGWDDDQKFRNIRLLLPEIFPAVEASVPHNEKTETKHGGGRPQLHAWSDAFDRLVIKIGGVGLPETGAELARMMEQCFADMKVDSPDLNKIEDWLRRNHSLVWNKAKQGVRN